MSAKRYDPQTKEQALEIYRTQGVTAAARFADCTKQSIYDWADAAGGITQDKEAIYQHKRSKLNHVLFSRIISLLQQMNSPVEQVTSYKGEVTHYSLARPSAADQKNLAIAAAVLIDKLRLEEGDVTKRFDTVDSGMLDDELVRLADELAEKAEGREVPPAPNTHTLGASAVS